MAMAFVHALALPTAERGTALHALNKRRANRATVAVSRRAHSRVVCCDTPAPAPAPTPPSASEPAPAPAIPKLGISFTCGVCDTRVSKMVRRSSYEKGVVLIQCPNCKTKHVIADHLGWYSDRDEKNRDIESMAKAKGEKVLRVDASQLDFDKMFKE